MFLIFIFLFNTYSNTCFKDFTNFKKLEFKKTDLNQIPKWDLSYIYENYKDSDIEDDCYDVYKDAINFRIKYDNKLKKEDFTPKEFLETLKTYENILKKLIIPINYLSNLSRTQILNEDLRVKLNKIEKQYSKTHKEISFFENKLAKTSDQFQKLMLNSLVLKNYKTYLENIFKTKPYLLSENEEKIIIDKDINGKNAWKKFRSIYETKFSFKMPGDKNSYTLTQIIKFLYSPNRKLRKQATKVYLEKFKKENEIFSHIYNSIIQDNISINKNLRGFDSVYEKRNFSNSLSNKTVDNLHKVVRNNYSLARKYWNLKAKILKIKEFYNYDLYAPYKIEKPFAYSYNEAINLIQDTINEFYLPLGEVFKNLYSCGLVDAKVYKGKRSGAYCSSFGPKYPPLVFMNFTGKLADLFTLAHEGGHWLHFALMAKNQTFLNNNVPIPVAETASIFNEILLSQRIIKDNKRKNQELISFLIDKIDRIFATVFRQTVFSFFEKEVFDKSNDNTLKSEELASIFEKQYKKLYKNSVKMTKDYKYEWARIPHFVNTPFYVYSYAFGELISAAIYQKYIDDPKEFSKKYYKFLSTGGSLNPKELYEELDIDIKSKSTWNLSFKYIKNLIDELEYLYKLTK